MYEHMDQLAVQSKDADECLGKEGLIRGDEEEYVGIRVVGRGGMGTVLLAAHHSCSEQVVAIKAIRKKRANLAGIHTEAEVLALVGDHRFLPRLHSHFESEEHAFLVMDYCAGGDLNTLRQRQPDKRLTETAIRFYAAELVLALEHLHGLGIVYRDLKPENVLISDAGHVVLTDFDLALRLAGPGGSTAAQAAGPDIDAAYWGAVSVGAGAGAGAGGQPAAWMKACGEVMRKVRWRQSRVGAAPEQQQQQQQVIFNGGRQFVGTEEYVAPEVIKGEGYRAAGDWWALGVLLYELLFGRTPFKGSDRRSTFCNIVAQAAPELRLLRPASRSCTSGPAEYPLRHLLRRLLQKDPTQRLAGAQQVKAHPFFRGVQWHLLHLIARPPFLPAVVPRLPRSIDRASCSLDKLAASSSSSSSSSSTLSFARNSTENE